MHYVFALKQLGDLDYFLGIEVKRCSNGSLLLSQSKYIRDLLAKVGMTDAKGIATPLQGGLKLSKHGSKYMDDPLLYRSIVGALQYVTITRPELSYSVNKVCQFMAQPLLVHWQAVKRILRYLKGTLAFRLHLRPAALTNGSYTLNAYYDVDWALDVDDRRSTSGACIFFGPNLVS